MARDTLKHYFIYADLLLDPRCYLAGADRPAVPPGADRLLAGGEPQLGSGGRVLPAPCGGAGFLRGGAGVAGRDRAGTFFGLVAHATYDLTKLATVDRWPIAVTAAEHWRRGLGKAVMLEGLRRLTRLGCTRVFSSATEEPADGLYRSVMTDMKVTVPGSKNPIKAA